MDGNFNNENNKENGRNASYENEKPWFLTPSVTVEKGHNPYRSGETVFEETFKKHPYAFRGANRLENESDAMYYCRRADEWSFARREARKGLQKSSCYIAAILLLCLTVTDFIDICLQFAVSGVAFEILATVIRYLFAAPAIILVANIGQKHKALTFFKKPQASGLFILKWSIIAIGATYVVGIASDLMFEYAKLFGVNVNDLSQPIPDNPVALTVSFFSVVIAAPIFEEMLFRGVILTHHMKYGCWHAIIVSGILFGLFHQNHQQMFYAAAVGMIFGYIDVKAGSVIPSLIAHFSVNAFSFISSFLLHFTNYNETLNDPSLQLDGPAFAVMTLGILDMLLYAFMLLSIGLFVYETTKNKSDFQLPKGDSFLTEREKFWSFWSQPLMIALLVICAFVTYLISFFVMPVLV